mmetsp:Transcript_16479/g.41930  ORF Transcript_16479/g.41930 Transcript_16479/m.41930 type:complete len:209 (+) Transcript_16479:88-714(+)
MDARDSVASAALLELEQAPKPSSDGASSSSCEPRRKPTWCAPDAILGEWRSSYGIYTITLNDQMELDFRENDLHGVLRLQGEWYTAVIHNSSMEADSVFGYLRLRREGEVIRSHFKFQEDEAWEDSGAIDAKPLPYLRIGALAANEAAGEANHVGGWPWNQTTCCICFEALEDGDDFAELQCHHMYHRSCIRTWFVRSGSCPVRCTQP